MINFRNFAHLASDEKMDAVVCHGPKDYRVEKVLIPKAQKNEIIMRIVACGICTSDCKCYQGAKYFWDDTGGKPMIPTPIVPGHEFFGYVEELGDGADKHFGVKRGDRIIAENILPCRECKFCKSGRYGMCEVHDIYGFQLDGAFAKYMRVPERSNIYKIPESLSIEDCSIIEPLAGAIHAVNRADIQFDDVVVIAGAGPLGLLMCQVARLKTPKKLIVIDLMDEKLILAKRYGADLTINPKQEDARKVVKGITEGYGCDVYIEVTGATEGVKQGLEMIRRLGRFVEFSIFGHDITCDWSMIGDRKELDIRGSHAGPYCYPVAIDLLERRLVTSQGIVTHTFPLTDWDKAIEVACSLDSIKVLLKP